MKAIVYEKYGSPDVLELAEVPKPVPKDNEVLVKIHATAVTAVDTGYRRTFGQSNRGKMRKRRLGYYLAGEVEEVGKNVRRFKPGDKVYGGDVFSSGAYAEYKCVREKGILVKKPDKMSYEEGAALTYGGLTALPFLRGTSKIKKGQTVLIIGATGSIGTYAVQLARYYGAEVTGVCSSGKTDLVKSLGASEVIDYTKDDFTKNGKTYDIIFDAAANSSFSQCKGSLTKNGKYLTTVPWPKTILQMIWTSVASRKKAIFAPMGLRPKQKKIQDLVYLNKLFEAGEIKPFIDKTFPMEQMVEAHKYVDTGSKKGNVVITVGHDMD